MSLQSGIHFQALYIYYYCVFDWKGPENWFVDYKNMYNVCNLIVYLFINKNQMEV